MKKLSSNVFYLINNLSQQIETLESRIFELEKKLDKALAVERNHLIRIKNKEDVSDDFIYNGRSYQDLTPEKAYRLYKNKDFDFILLDVSSRDFKSPEKMPEALHIPWEELEARFLELTQMTTPILVISEDGVKSVLACEFLVKRGYYNCNNISGGHKFWPGYRLKEVSERTA